MSDGTPVTGDLVARDLTFFQFNILVVLSRGPLYGLAIKRELEAYYADEVNHGRLYPNLDDLVETGLIEKSSRDKRTNEYALTSSGRDAVLDQLAWYFTYLAGADDLQSAVEERLAAAA